MRALGLEVGPRQKGRGHGFGGAESEFSAKFRWAGQRGLPGRAFSLAEGQVILLVVPALFRQSFWQGPTAEASSLEPYLIPPPTPLGLRPQAQPRVRGSPQGLWAQADAALSSPRPRALR